MEGSRPTRGRERAARARAEEVVEERRGDRSDLGPRILVAIPAIIFAVFIVVQGGLVFAAGLFVLGVIALRELYTLMGRVQPAVLAGFLTLAGLLIAALYGEPRHLVMVLVAAFPVTFFLALLRPRRENVSWAIAVTLFGVFWIGLAMAHAVWLRELVQPGQRRRGDRDRDGPRDQHADRHLPRRHVRLLRRTLLRAHPAARR